MEWSYILLTGDEGCSSISGEMICLRRHMLLSHKQQYLTILSLQLFELKNAHLGSKFSKRATTHFLQRSLLIGLLNPQRLSRRSLRFQLTLAYVLYNGNRSLFRARFK